MTDDAIIGLQAKAAEVFGTENALSRVNKALEAVREHRPVDVFDLADEPGFDTGNDDLSGF